MLDPGCYDLAVEILEEKNPHEKIYDLLAWRIQAAIDDFLEDLDSEIEAKRDEAIDRKREEKRDERG